jgi:hypothetical protein
MTLRPLVFRSGLKTRSGYLAVLFPSAKERDRDMEPREVEAQSVRD